MEQDLAARAGDFLSEHFRERLSDDDRLALEHWMTSRLEAERRGWKNTLQRSLQEVEKERKMALEGHVTIQKLNERLEGHMGELVLSREPSMYYSSEVDSRVYTINALEKNVETVLNCVKGLLEERAQCFSCIGLLEESGINLDVAVSERLVGLHTDLVTAEKGHQEGIDRLKKEIEQMSLRLEGREGEDKTRDERHLKEIDALTEIITRQRAKMEDVNHWTKSDVATQTGLTAQDMGIQVDFDGDSGPDRSASSSVMETIVRVPPPIKSVTISRSVERSNGTRGWTTHRQDVERVWNSTSSSPVKHSDEYQDAKARDRGSARSLETKDFERKHTIEALRGQVIEFAERLERAKDEVERYQRQLAWMKTTPHSTLLNREIAHMRHPEKTGSQYEDGFLSGTRKDILPAVYRSPDVVMLKAHLRKRQAAPVGASNSTTRCLRCHKLYKVRDNHRKACRYHARGKRKIEKYDNNGKLVTVTYLWECCLQATDAHGCSTGEHI